MHHNTQNAILTKLSLQEYGNRVPYFHGENLEVFHGENLAVFRVWCAMAYQQGFMSVYTVHMDMLVL